VQTVDWKTLRENEIEKALAWIDHVDKRNGIVTDKDIDTMTQAGISRRSAKKIARQVEDRLFQLYTEDEVLKRKLCRKKRVEEENNKRERIHTEKKQKDKDRREEEEKKKKKTKSSSSQNRTSSTSSAKGSMSSNRIKSADMLLYAADLLVVGKGMKEKTVVERVGEKKEEGRQGEQEEETEEEEIDKKQEMTKREQQKTYKGRKRVKQRLEKTGERYKG
jgi:hypothetical protein